MENNTQMTNSSQQSGFPVQPMLVVAVLVLVGSVGFAMMKMNNKSVVTPTPVVPEQTEVMTDTTENTPTATATTSTSTSTSTSLVAGENLVTIKMEAGSFYYAPNEIKVKQGQEVRIEMTSKDMMHNFIIDELDVEIPITKAGNTATVEFVADQVGTFEYYCGVGQHRANGQVGTLIVEK